MGDQAIGDYRVEAELARGGAGVVYRGRAADGQAVAIKVLLAAGRDHARRRFRREAEALTAVRHAGIVGVRAVGEHEGRPYLVLDYVDGPSLAARLLREGSLPVGEAVELTRQVAEAIAHAHAHGVLHRDLKPDNVLVEQGCARVTDFGLTRRVVPSSSQTRLSQTGEFLGTPGYWSPEQAKGQLDRVDARTDVYGLGALLFALLTGQPPQQGETLVERIAALDAPVPRPSRLRPGVGAALERVCLRCLEREPDDRYPDARAVAEALAGVQSASAEPSGSGARAAGAARGPGAAAVALGLVVLGALAAGGVVWQRRAQQGAGGGRGEAAEPAAWAEARALLASARATHEDDPRASQADARRATELAPELGEAWAVYGVSLALAGDSQQGATALRRAVTLDPQDAKSWRNLAGCLVDLDPSAALEAADRAIALESGDPRAYSNRAMARAALGDDSGAQADCDAALRVDPDYPPGLDLRAQLHRRAGDFVAERADRERIVELRPQDGQAWIALSEALGREGDPQAQLQALVRGLDLAPSGVERVDAWATLGALHAATGDTSAAHAALQRALNLEPEHARALTLRGFLAFDDNELTFAYKDWTRALAVDPSLPERYPRLSEAYARAKQATEQIPAVVLEAQALNDQAMQAYHRGDFDQARELYGRSIELAPSQAPPYVNLVRLLLEVGDLDAASAAADRAVELAPRWAVSWWMRATVRQARGEERARIAEDLSRARRANPTPAVLREIRALAAEAGVDLPSD